MKAAAASTINGAAMDVERAILSQFLFVPNFDQRFGHFDGCGG